jgi:hypothetical protein
MIFLLKAVTVNLAFFVTNVPLYNLWVSKSGELCDLIDESWSLWCEFSSVIHEFGDLLCIMKLMRRILRFARYKIGIDGGFFIVFKLWFSRNNLYSKNYYVFFYNMFRKNDKNFAIIIPIRAFIWSRSDLSKSGKFFPNRTLSGIFV